MTKNTWIIFAVICAALIGGLIWSSRSAKTNVEDVTVSTVQTASEANGGIGDHTIGNPDAKVVVIEYADYNCPGCKVADPALKASVDNYKDDVLLVLRNYPIARLHPNARAAAAAAESAGLQDKYLVMHDKLYQTSEEWQSATIEKRTDLFEKYATDLGLDISKFSSDMTSDKVKAKIDYDFALGQKAGVSGTPAIYINGKSVNSYVKDGKIVPASTKDAQPIWASQEAFTKYGLMPALKEAGVSIKEE